MKSKAILKGHIIEKKMTHDSQGTRYRIEGPVLDGRIIHIICFSVIFVNSVDTLLLWLRLGCTSHFPGKSSTKRSKNSGSSKSATSYRSFRFRIFLVGME
uniref:Uncharacterized protein n=1 Tax=Candidatus Kentrum sp. MB TaxID=2138164 RepID=A0A450X515_9GAMM|nr:MAG: hypothetical protein BECKMB1821G_GA0114241_100816 [Candidatus Kentron sp. MB]VFK34312.1 MAG: hypothetical protein BECKMB1821I_GA0114274_106715 [Candidatus Kentron sp. MB]VFK76649.1 MAG: hypothetical protein BECKMB1821H_GA0114242_106615 [Candidatus Kentron sp. MB]